jgi:hypothetical protein
MRYLLILFLIVIYSLSSYSGNKINYIEPRPGSNFVNINDNIIIGFEKEIRMSEHEISNCIIIYGSESKRHEVRVLICPDRKKVLFKPLKAFNYNEKVDVKIEGEFLRTVSSARKVYEYSFTTSDSKPESRILKQTENIYPQLTDLLDPPLLNVTINNNPSEGFIFTAPWAGTTYLTISHNNGMHYWFSEPIAFAGDFKKQSNGNLTFFNGVRLKHFEMDNNYNIIDSFACGNGYVTDLHELRLLANGNALVMAYDTQIVDMSEIVEGGNPQAAVIGLIIQEIDGNKDVVFQWRSWDHFAITDVTHENLLDSVIDYVHGNAIEIDNDGNIMISSRHLDEITKISRTTGEIIWRLGGKNNQFTFVNDTLRFSYQHAIRRIANGNITLYDNGNYHSPPFSRAVEYSLDESNKTATLVWQFRRTPSIFGSWGGYVQRLPGGNTLIAWGGAAKTITEVTPQGTVVFEASYPATIYTYRAYKFDWGNPVIVKNENNTSPGSFRLYRNYPNPFNPYTIIEFDLPKTIFTEMAVYDITGTEVKKIISEELQKGSYSYKFDGTGFASGVYFYTLRAGNFISAQKMILVK